MIPMFQTRCPRLFFLAILTLPICARAQTAPDVEVSPATQPDIHKADLLGAKFTSHTHGIEFRTLANSTQAENTSPDTIAEFDRDDYDWRMRVWSVTLQRSIPLTIHKDQFGNPQDGVMEITLANIKQQQPNVEVVRNEVINVGHVRIGMIAVRYKTASHDVRYTQQAIIEAPNANDKFYYFFDLTGPGKPEYEDQGVINPAEKLAFDTFSEVIDSVNLLDRSNIVDYQNEGLYATRNLFVVWNGDDSKIIRAAVVPEEYQRIIKDGQDIGYQHIVESYSANLKTPEESILKVGIRSRMSPSPLRQWDTQTWMYSSADRKHEHWKTAAQCTDNHGKVVDSFSQIGVSDEANKPVVIQSKPNSNGSLLPESPQESSQTQSPEDSQDNPFGPSRQGNVEIDAVRSLQVTTVHRGIQLNPFRLDVPVFYVPQAFSYMLPRLLPLKPNHYMFAVFVANSPEETTATGIGNVMSRFIEVQNVQHVNFHGQSFDAIPITDKITFDGPVTTYYMGVDGKFLGSTSTYPDGDKTTTVDIMPTDSQTLSHIWNSPDLSSPTEPAGGDTPPAIPSEPPQ
jgi:hypothetical protein